jgi:hypothetical protein
MMIQVGQYMARGVQRLMDRRLHEATGDQERIVKPLLNGDDAYGVLYGSGWVSAGQYN